VVTDQSVSFVVPKGADMSSLRATVSLNEETAVVAPLKQGTELGSVTYSYKVPSSDEPVEKTVKLITAQDADKANWFKLFLRAIGDFFKDLFNGIKNLF